MRIGTVKSPKSPQQLEESGLNNSKVGLGQTNSSWGNNASLKGKLMSLEEVVKQVVDDMEQYRRDARVFVEIGNMEKEANQQLGDLKKELIELLTTVEDNMRKGFAQQKAENSRIQQQITALKGEKTALQQQLLGLQRRITDVEYQVGSTEETK